MCDRRAGASPAPQGATVPRAPRANSLPQPDSSTSATLPFCAQHILTTDGAEPISRRHGIIALAIRNRARRAASRGPRHPETRNALTCRFARVVIVNAVGLAYSFRPVPSAVLQRTRGTPARQVWATILAGGSRVDTSCISEGLGMFCAPSSSRVGWSSCALSDTTRRPAGPMPCPRRRAITRGIRQPPRRSAWCPAVSPSGKDASPIGDLRAVTSSCVDRRGAWTRWNAA
jgi:hypothetical protein